MSSENTTGRKGRNPGARHEWAAREQFRGRVETVVSAAGADAMIRLLEHIQRQCPAASGTVAAAVADFAWFATTDRGLMRSAVRIVRPGDLRRPVR